MRIAIKGVEKLLEGLKPLSNCSVQSVANLAGKKAEIDAMRTMPVVDWERRYGYCEGSAAEVIQRYQKS